MDRIEITRRNSNAAKAVPRGNERSSPSWRGQQKLTLGEHIYLPTALLCFRKLFPFPLLSMVPEVSKFSVTFRCNAAPLSKVSLDEKLHLCIFQKLVPGVVGLWRFSLKKCGRVYAIPHAILVVFQIKLWITFYSFRGLSRRESTLMGHC